MTLGLRATSKFRFDFLIKCLLNKRKTIQILVYCSSFVFSFFLLVFRWCPQKSALVVKKLSTVSVEKENFFVISSSSLSVKIKIHENS